MKSAGKQTDCTPRIHKYVYSSEEVLWGWDILCVFRQLYMAATDEEIVNFEKH